MFKSLHHFLIFIDKSQPLTKFLRGSETHHRHQHPWAGTRNDAASFSQTVTIELNKEMKIFKRIDIERDLWIVCTYLLYNFSYSTAIDLSQCSSKGSTQPERNPTMPWIPHPTPPERRGWRGFVDSTRRKSQIWHFFSSFSGRLKLQISKLFKGSPPICGRLKVPYYKTIPSLKLTAKTETLFSGAYVSFRVGKGGKIGVLFVISVSNNLFGLGGTN